ncbi:TetR/AcrR family transcriptional regulator, transcriptional repressor for nem operon [Paenibacillus catalpae]|uniref:TetR/AcrR family transcriptional regulator, transcriptional repressor for nem operon n=1 Tax=Paenibacillus catalpae TaxID=1045775 RepID=A0A1I1YQJ5_9BACL|nr:TetR/AcrR family transcriptional regulator [Paenibacillus catalpae]SFE21797.1 TetR/AcrR family transcriptional regulator, transcriptional repressor for nem operon [Paenibacillus catalpae]
MTRSKEFDEREVLLKAMYLFWEKGYEKTSLQDLVTHMGIHRRSLYDTFGDKHSLFVKTLELYEKHKTATIQAEVIRGRSAKQAIRFIFDLLIEVNDDRPLGCLFVNSATELALRDPEVREITNEGFNNGEKVLLDIIQKGQQSGEIPIDKDAKLLAAFLQTTLIGLRVLVRTSTDKKKLHQIADISIAMLDA